MANFRRKWAEKPNFGHFWAKFANFRPIFGDFWLQAVAAHKLNTESCQFVTTGVVSCACTNQPLFAVCSTVMLIEPGPRIA
jgi:hypothetical protein